MITFKTFVSGILAGACIALGGIAFLSLENKVLGAMLFTVGLFCVCTFGLNLYTGKVCYIFQKDKAYVLNIPIIWLGNLVGTAIVAAMVRATRMAGIAERAAGMCQTKLADNLLSIFILSILCNIFIYIGVENYNKNPHELGKYLGMFLGIMVFILCGFEHCVANMFYFSVTGMWSGKTLLYLLVMTVGNAVGGVTFPLLRGFLAK